MITMTTRSSRLFVVLLHLVGVSTHLPTSFSGGRGIVGVNPLSIVLETLDPSSLAPGGQLEGDDQSESDSRIQLLHGQPHWLQDALGDQKCLDPMGGFSECGDATLWLVIPKKSTRRQARWRKWVTWATEEEETEENTSNSRIQGYALQLYDDTHQQQTTTMTATTTTTQPRERHQEEASNSRSMEEIASSLASSSLTFSYAHYHAPPSKDDWADRECLTRLRKGSQLILVPCSQDRAWAWHFNEHGIMHFKKPKTSSPLGGNKGGEDSAAEARRLKQKRLLQTTREKKTLECMARNTSQAAVLIPCDGRQAPPSGLEEAATPSVDRVLQVVLVRQATSPAPEQGHRPIADDVPSPNKNAAVGGQQQQQQEQRLPPSQSHFAQTHASASSKHAELKRSPSLTGLSSKHSVSSSSSSGSGSTASSLPLSFFKNTNPILLANNHVGLSEGSPMRSKIGERTLLVAKRASDSMGKTASTTSGPGARTARPVAIRKIQTNPYITDSQDERWTDPQTGLLYRTDLCHYLGHDRKEVGRHTLVGVGQFMKTVFNIKVYGVAFYVSKRDLLADPAMDQYATLTTEELRAQPAFYETLRHMTPSTNPAAGTFDRTLFLNTNMQLATDTMRSSLDSDWKLLTQEAKDLMINSSMRPRPASDAMMEVIQSPDNPSKCSCAQVASAEYGADPSCCARGTELVFTWRKSGALEVRLNGDLMDSFDRPDIAAAIFYEYLRLDDPMSSDFLEKVVNGFPMLLGPLAQVKGVSSPTMAPSTSPTSSPKGTSGPNPLTRAFQGVGGALSSGASNVADLVHHGATELGTGAVSAARSIGDAARNVGEEMERRRDLIGQHVSHFAHQTISSIYSGKDQKVVATLPKWLETMPFDIPFEDDGTPTSTTTASRGSIFRGVPILSKLFGGSETAAAPDEIVPMIHPSANRTQHFFLGVVHLYLLLILIVSFPADLTTRTKLVITRKAKLTGVQPVSDSDSEEGSSTESEHNPRKTPTSKGGINRGFPSFGQRPYLSSNL